MARRALVGLVWAQDRRGVIGAAGGMPWHVPEDLAHFKAVTMGAPVVMGRRTWDSLNPRFRPLPGRTNIVVTRQAGWPSPAPASAAGGGAEPDAAMAAALAEGRLRVAHGLREGLQMAVEPLREAHRQGVLDAARGGVAGGTYARVDGAGAGAGAGAGEADAWVIGGAQLFAEALDAGVVSVIERTLLDLDVTERGVVADTFAPELDERWQPVPEAGTDWEFSRSGVRYRFERLVRA
ncbi:dihydrofolate reductase [Pseudoclavibacter soli]|uniref:dihydrofolate reductase n=1 Tax=Pseudoclavibacter soli TaxID=452623 RepID=UPI000409E326